LGNQITNIDILAGLTNLKTLYIDHNQINTIDALADLTNSQYLNLESNQISDITPLVANSQQGGLGQVDEAYLSYNYLDLSSISQTMIDIQTLKSDGVSVTYQPQNNGKA